MKIAHQLIQHFWFFPRLYPHRQICVKKSEEPYFLQSKIFLRYSKNRSFFLWVVFFLFIFIGGFAQEIPIGFWRTHSAYLPAKSIALTSEGTYCATENGLFFLDKTTNSLQTFSKIDGLSESIIQKIAYHAPSQTLLIVYENSNIDLIRNQEIIEIPLIKNANINGSKKINHIHLYQNLAYLSADFGLVVLDLAKQEIKETLLNIGTNGSSIAITSSAVSNDSLFISSNQGVAVGSLNDNLLDFNNWRLFNFSQGLPFATYPYLVSRNNQIYALSNQAGLFRYSHTSHWTPVALPPLGGFGGMSVSNNQIIIQASDKLLLVNPSDLSNILTNPLIQMPQEVFQDNQSRFWIADFRNGLVSDFQGIFQAFFPNGVARASVTHLSEINQEILALSGGFTENYQALNQDFGYYVFQNPSWINFNSYDTRNAQSIPNVKDLVGVVHHPTNQNIYLASFGDGILVKKQDNSFEIINQNSPQSPLVADATGKVKITDLAIDRQGSIWVANHSLSTGQKPIHVLKTDNSWQSYNAINSASLNPLEILIDFNDFKWIRLSPNRGGGIWILDEKTNRNRYLSTNPNEGSLPSNNVYSITQDREGQIWIGTERGVVVIFNPAQVFDGAVNAITPIFENRPLLRTEKINVIYVDAGNRKWIGTDNGVWLFNADGSRQIEYFNSQNSPILSDKIIDIAINRVSGEVFFATDKGLISYRGTATEASSPQQNVKIFPNPVRPDFSGVVGISGLAENATVKITDISGRLFYQTEAQGGTATWNLQNYNGTRAKTGIYLIFSTNFDGTDVFVGKIAVVE